MVQYAIAAITSTALLTLPFYLVSAFMLHSTFLLHTAMSSLCILFSFPLAISHVGETIYLWEMIFFYHQRPHRVFLL